MSLSEFFKDERSEGPAPTDAGMRRFFSEVAAELKHQGAAGAHELASAIFRGDAFVMYGNSPDNSGQQAQGHGLDGVQHPEMPIEQSRGREM